MLESLANRLKGKVLILGVGNPLRGDDGAGPYLIERLRGCVHATLLDCEDVPENFLGLIAENQPGSVLLIDAIDLGMTPGATALLEGDELEGVSLSTHHSSLQLFIKCLKAETGTNVLVMGIQPKSTRFGDGISSEVKETLDLLHPIIKSALSPEEPINIHSIDIRQQ
jgi:hydrogenase 3 maturation protease